MTKNLVIYEKTLSMIEYGTIALQQFPKHEKFVLAAIGLGLASVFYAVVVVNNFKNARK